MLCRPSVVKLYGRIAAMVILTLYMNGRFAVDLKLYPKRYIRRSASFWKGDVILLVNNANGEVIFSKGGKGFRVF